MMIRAGKKNETSTVDAIVESGVHDGDDKDDESVDSNKRCKFNTKDGDINQKDCTTDNYKDGCYYLDMEEVTRKEDEFLTGVKEVNQSIREMEEQLNYILR